MQNRLPSPASTSVPLQSSTRDTLYGIQTSSVSQSCTVSANGKIVLRRKPVLALTGQYQNGKSTFLNCLLGGAYAVEGDGTVTTKYNANYVYGDFCDVKILFPDGSLKPLSLFDGAFSAQNTLQEMDQDIQLQVCVYSPTLQRMDILDSPGCGANQQNNAIAENALNSADFIIYVIQKTLDNKSDVSFLKRISEQNKHFTIVLNCLNEIDPLSTHVGLVCKEIMAKIKSVHLDRNYVSLFDKCPVYPVNLLWAQCALGYLDPVSNKKKWSKVKYYFDQDDITSLMLLSRSNFLPMRKLLESYVSEFFDYKPSSALSIFSTLSQEWTSELIDALKENK